MVYFLAQSKIKILFLFWAVNRFVICVIERETEEVDVVLENSFVCLGIVHSLRQFCWPVSYSLLYPFPEHRNMQNFPNNNLLRKNVKWKRSLEGTARQILITSKFRNFLFEKEKEKEFVRYRLLLYRQLWLFLRLGRETFPSHLLTNFHFHQESQSHFSLPFISKNKNKL